MANSSAVLLVDDGELDDVAKILESLATDFERLQGGSIPAEVASPRRLLVSTPRRIGSVREADSEAEPPIRIVVVSEDSNALRAQLRESGFDYLIRRPVHPEALRLLLAHCLYRGEERRSEPRVAVGFEVSFHTGVLSRRATLADLSTRGCRLLSPYPLATGKRISLTLPESLGAAETLVLEGRVVRNHFDASLGLDGLYATAVAFDDPPRETRNELEWIIEDKLTGPPTLAASKVRSERPETRTRARSPRRRRQALRETFAERCPPDPRSENAAVATSAPESVAPLAVDVDVKLADADRSERRTSDRRPFGAKVPAFGDRALRVLVGRDLSVGGMRIERNTSIEIGDRMHLAIYSSSDQEPLLVWGTLTRDDRDLGMGIEFDEVHPSVAERLEKLVAGLPSVESLRDGEIDAMGTVLSEILDG